MLSFTQEMVLYIYIYIFFFKNTDFAFKKQFGMSQVGMKQKFWYNSAFFPVHIRVKIAFQTRLNVKKWGGHKVLFFSLVNFFFLRNKFSNIK